MKVGDKCFINGSILEYLYDFSKPATIVGIGLVSPPDNPDFKYTSHEKGVTLKTHDGHYVWVRKECVVLIEK